MHAFIEWRDDWLLDIEQVDEEHQDLVRLINRLAGLYGCTRCPNPQAQAYGTRVEILHLLERLGDHARIHFEHEEAYMRDLGYPGLEDHCYEHLTLLAEYSELMRDVHAQGLGCLDDSTLRGIKGWIIGHIATADRRFGEFYQEHVLGIAHRDEFTRRWMRISLAE